MMQRIINNNRLLLTLIIGQIVILGLFTVQLSDAGIYLSVCYQYLNGVLPYIDFGFPQGFGYPLVMSQFMRIFGVSILSHFITIMIFSMFSLWLVFKITRTVLLRNGMKLQKIHVSFLLIMFLISIDYWYFMRHTGTKSAFPTAFILLESYLLYLYILEKKLFFLVSATALTALIIMAKYTFGTLVIVNVVYLWFYSDTRVKDIKIAVGVFFISVFFIHIELIAAVGPFDAIGLMVDNLNFMKIAYNRPYSVVRKISSFAVLGNYFIFKYLILIPPLLYLFREPFFSREKILKKENSIILLLLGIAMAYMISNVIVLYPIIDDAYYQIMYPFVIVPVFILYFLHYDTAHIKAMTEKKIFIAFCIVILFQNMGFAFLHRLVPFTPKRFVYQVLGRNGAVSALDRLYKTGKYTHYLYIGRNHQDVITSKLKQSSWSVLGMAVMGDIYLNPDSATANRLKFLDMSNLDSLLKQENVVVLEYYRLKKSPGRYEKIVTMLEEYGYKEVYADPHTNPSSYMPANIVFAKGNLI